MGRETILCAMWWLNTLVITPWAFPQVLTELRNSNPHTDTEIHVFRWSIPVMNLLECFSRVLREVQNRCNRRCLTRTCELVHEDRKCCILNSWSQNHGWERRKFRSFPPPVLCTHPQFILGDTKTTRSERVQSLIIGRVPAETSSGIVAGYQVQSVSCMLSRLCVRLVGFVLVLVLGCWPRPV